MVEYKKSKDDKKLPEEVYNKLLEYLGDLKYGSVTLVIQDEKIVQIDKNEKYRL